MAMQETFVISENRNHKGNTGARRGKRGVGSYEKDPRVYLDGIGQPQGIPHEYKVRSKIYGGFEALIPTIGIAKAWESINYIYYNQQRFIHYTTDALAALGERLDATSKMAMQNRMV